MIRKNPTDANRGGGSVSRVKKSGMRDPHPECRRKLVPSSVPEERGKQSSNNRSIPSYRGVRSFILEEILAPGR